MPIGTAKTDVCLLLGSTATVSAGNIGLLLGLGLYFLLLRFAELRPLEGYARGHRLVDFLVADVTFHCFDWDLVMEKANACECHRDAVLVTCIDNMVIANAAACLSYVTHATLMGTLDVVTEGEEGIGA